MLAWVLGTVVGLVLLIIIALQFSSVQQFAAQKGAAYLSDMLKTEVRIGRFTTDWRNSIVLKDVYVEDQQQDTLWYSGRLGIDLDIFGLVSGKANINRVHLQNATVNLHIRPDSSSNFAFLLDAFATDTTLAQPADTAAAMEINLGIINLENVYLNFRDEYAGNFVKGRVGQFLTTFEEFDLDKQLFRVDEVELSRTWVTIVQTKIPPEEEPQPLTVNFGLNRVALDSIQLSFRNRVAGQYLTLDLGNAEVTANEINLPNARLDLGKAEINNTKFAYSQEKYKSSDSLAINPKETAEKLDESVEKTQGQPVFWMLSLDELNVAGLQARIDNHNMPEQPRGIDFDHLLVSNVQLVANELNYSESRMGANIEQLKLEEKSGFRIENMQAEVSIDSTSAYLNNLDLRTEYSHLQNTLKASYPSLDAALENPEVVRLNIDLDKSYISMKDVLYFVPDLRDNPSFGAIAQSTLHISGQATGTLDNLTIRQLHASGLSGTALSVSGSIRNVTDPDNLYLDLRIPRLTTTRTDVLALAPKGTLPPDIRIPPSLTLSGNFEGTLTNFDANADVRTTFGNLTAQVAMEQGAAGQEPFSARFQTQNLDLGKLLVNNAGLGKVSASGTISGRGLTPETMVAQLKAEVQSVQYNGQTYQNITVNSDINRNLYTVDARSADPNLAFGVNGTINLRNANNPIYDIDLKLESVNLQALGLYSEDLQIKGDLTTDLRGSTLQTLEGTLAGRNLIIRHKQVSYPVDSLILNISQTQAGTAIALNSDLATVRFTSKNDLATLATALQKHFSNYFDLQPDPPYPAALSLKDFDLEARLRKTDLLISFVPGLEILVPNQPITASYNGQTQDLKANAGFARLKYMGYSVTGISLVADGNRNKIDYTLRVKEVADSTLQIRNLSVIGSARDNQMLVRAAIAEADSTERFVLGGTFNSLGPGYRFSINPGQLVINSDKWSVPAQNYIQFGTNLLYASNVRLERNGSFLLLNSTGPVSATAPLQVQFGNFDLGYVMQTVQRTDSLVAGIVNGSATITNVLSGSPGFNADLTVSQFAYLGTLLGDVALQASNSGPSRYNLNATLTGNGNQLAVNGYYDAAPENGALSLNANIGAVNLASLQGFTQGMVKDMGGSATGQLAITGSLTQPNIRGELTFQQAQFNIAMLNTLYRLPNERLVFNEQGIVFPNVNLTDVNGNSLLLNGTILTQNYTDFRFDLTASTNRFLAMNSTAKDNSLYYGRLEFSANATIKGETNLPVIKGTATVLDNSELTFVIPGAAAGAAEREGVVEFFDMSDSLATVNENMLANQSATSGITGVEIDIEVTVTDATPITVVLDPVTGDHLVARGNSRNLAAGMKANGDLTLSGRYELTEGQYKMIFYNLVSRELALAEGSSIEWYGDPLQANMDVTAIYEIRTGAMELVADQLANREQTELNRFRTPIPFEVLVSLEGQMLKPEIEFDIQLDEKAKGENPAVVARLEQLRQDEAEQNKQVFALLVLGRFLAEDPLASSGGGLSASARSSVSQVLSDQLNKLTQQYAPGLGLEVGVTSYEDYSTGSGEGRTDLNVALRQQFLNDRVTVRVGGDVGLEGSQREQRGMSGFGGDISVEYTILPDGRLRVRGFRRTQYEDFIEGDVQETGLALIYQRDYNNFSDLFRSLEKRKEKQQERTQKEEQKIKEKAAEDEQELKQEQTKPNNQ